MTAEQSAREQSACGGDPCDIGTPLDQLKYYRDEVQFAIGQLNVRVGAYLTSQSFLLITLGSVLNNTKKEWEDVFSPVMPLLLAALGIALTLAIRPGIIASLEVIAGWHKRQRELIEKYPELDIYNVKAGEDNSTVGSSDLTEDSASQRKSILYAIHVMMILAAAWVAVIIFALYLHFTHSG